MSLYIDRDMELGGNICFPANTPVTTDQGIIRIDQLVRNINTIRKQPIVAITKTILNGDYLVCFEKDSIFKNVPNQKTTMSPQHKIFYNGNLIEAKDFLDKFNAVSRVPYAGEPLYNVLMEDYNKMLVNNLIVETLHPENPIAELYRLYDNPTRVEQEEYIRHQNNSLITMMELKQRFACLSK